VSHPQMGSLTRCFYFRIARRSGKSVNPIWNNSAWAEGRMADCFVTYVTAYRHFLFPMFYTFVSN